MAPTGCRTALVGLVVLACAMLAPGAARAEPSAADSALATLLFDQGRALIAEGQVPEACQKFAESQRLDPGGGTLLNLARCHEQEGRLASAWSEFQAAQSLARDGNRPDREAEATYRISALEPRLSRLSIVVPAAADITGLVVERDGRELGRGAWSTAIPIDGGEHVVRATAPGRQPFTLSIVIGRELDQQTIEVPILAALPEPMRLPPVAAPAASPPLPLPVPLVEAETFTPARLRWLGIGSAALGIVAWAGSGYALATALSAKHAAAADCYVDGCGARGMRKRSDAVSRGNLATLLGIGGAMLVGTGVTLFYFGQRSGSRPLDAPGSTRVLLGAAPGAVLTSIAGSL